MKMILARLFQISVGLALLLLGQACAPSAEELCKEARRELELGNYASAAQLLEPYTASGDTAAAPFLLTAVAYHQLGQWDKALPHYDRYVALRPDDYKGYFNRGSVWLAQEEFARAVPDFEQALARKDTADVRQNLSLAYIKTQQWQQAADVLRPLIRQDSTQVALRFNYANALLGAKDYAGSFYEFSFVLTKDSSLAGAWYGAGICLLMNKQCEQGCEALFKAKLLGHEPIREDLINVCEDYFKAVHQELKPIPKLDTLPGEPLNPKDLLEGIE